METTNGKMEQQILSAAKELFMKYGFDSISTTQIAKKVGCNQALVHYYYGTKTNLLERILADEINRLFECLSDLPWDESPIEEKVENMIDAHFSFLQINSNLPMFLLGEVRNNPKIFFNFQLMVKDKTRTILSSMQKILDKEYEAGKLKTRVDAFDVMLDMLSLSAFSIISKPLMSFWKMTEEEKNDVMQARKEHIKQVVVSYIKSLRA